MKELTTEIVSVDERDNLNKLRQFDNNSNITALILGKLLQENHERKYWKKLGYDSFNDFISQGNFSFTYRTAYNYIDLWKCFEQWKMSYSEFISIPYSKLLAIKDVVDKNNLRDWLEKAKTLSRTDLKTEVDEVTHNKGKKYKPFPKIYRCKDCDGFVIECNPEDLCVCGKGIDINNKRN